MTKQKDYLSTNANGKDEPRLLAVPTVMDADERLRQADFEIQYLSEQVEEQTHENRKLHEMLARRDLTIDELTREIDRLTTLLETLGQNYGALAKKLETPKA